MCFVDEWVRELVLQLPEVLWVITGRERLRREELDEDWRNCQQQHLVGGWRKMMPGGFWPLPG